MSSEQRVARRARLPYKWLALSVTTLGAAMAAIDSSIVILAIPRIMEDLHADFVTMTWVLMGYFGSLPADIEREFYDTWQMKRDGTKRGIVEVR